MIALSVNGLTKSFGGNTIFSNLSMDVQEKERVGLIGPNGCGKTTLMKILMGREDKDSGSIALKKDLSLGYLNQMPDYGTQMTVYEVMSQAFSELLWLGETLKDLEKKMSLTDKDGLERLVQRYGDLSHRFEEEGGYDIQMKLNKISEGLKIPKMMFDQRFEQLSGGEKTRVELAKILLEHPDVLLLDEPSNHLDLMSIEWLEEFLKDYAGTVITVSHDRYFLDRVANRIIEMSYDQMSVYHGNYSYYVVEKERRFLIDMKFYENQQKKIKRMEEQIKRYRVWGAMRDSDKMYRKAKELEKRLEKIDKVDRPRFDNAKVKFAFDQQSRSGKRVLVLKDVKKSFGALELFEHVNLDLFYKESLCLLGRNGSGKSTLLKMLIDEASKNPDVWIGDGDALERVSSDYGDIHFGSRIKVGYLPQEVVFPDDSQTILTYFTYRHSLPDSAARKELAKVLFVKDDINKKIRSLSGGEKSRLKLCSLMYEKVNLMILDEPTNHLDIDSREILEETLIDYEGTILFVSHDRYFIAKIANRVAEIEAGGLNDYPGNYEFYREKKLLKAEAAKPVVEEKGKTAKVRSSKKVPQKYTREFEALEVTIAELEAEQGQLDQAMADAASEPDRLSELFSEKEKTEESLMVAYERWEALTEIMSEYEVS